MIVISKNKRSQIMYVRQPVPIILSVGSVSIISEISATIPEQINASVSGPLTCTIVEDLEYSMNKVVTVKGCSFSDFS